MSYIFLLVGTRIFFCYSISYPIVPQVPAWKIHRVYMAGRRIFPVVSCLTSNIGDFLSAIFTSIVQTLPNYVKDSSNELGIFHNLKSLQNVFFFLQWLSSLYIQQFLTRIDWVHLTISWIHVQLKIHLLVPPFALLNFLSPNIAFLLMKQFTSKLVEKHWEASLDPNMLSFVGYQELLISHQDTNTKDPFLVWREHALIT